MTTHLPEPLVIDAEFVDDDEPNPIPDEERGTDRRPGRVATAAAFLARGTVRVVVRNIAATRTGLSVMVAERGAWLNGGRLSEAHLRTHLLNRRYAQWLAAQRTAAASLVEQAKALQTQADTTAAQAMALQTQAATAVDRIAKAASSGTDPLKAGRQAGADRQAAAKLLEAAAEDRAAAGKLLAAARELEQQLYLGHFEPNELELASHRRRVANGRRWKTAALGLVVGFAEIQIGPVLMEITAGGVLMAAWAKGRFAGWRSADPEIEALKYVPETGKSTVTAGQSADAPAAGPDPAQPGATHNAASPGPANAPADEQHAPADADEPDEETVLINAALTAAGLLPTARRGKPPLGVQVIDAPDYSIGNGFVTTVDLPVGGGKLVRHALAKADVIAGELSVPVTQLAIREVPAAEGGHGRRMQVWVADEDPYLAVGHDQSPLVLAATWDFWGGVPFGKTILAERRSLLTQFAGGFTSMFFSGMMRFGKSFAMRVAVAAALLDPGLRLYLANGKQGADWKSAKKVAHRFTEGTGEEDLARFEAMLDELVEDMEQRYRDFGDLDVSLVPEGRLTPKLARHHGMPILLAVIDELQLYLLAMTPKRRARALEKLKNLLRGGPAAGVFLICGSQRPDGEEVPTGFRDLFGVRVSVRCPDKRSSRMCLGDLASDNGADSSVLTEDHVGITVVAVGHRWEILSTDFLTSAEFDEICERARAMREREGTLTGDAVGDVRVTEPTGIRAVRACVDALHELETDRATIARLAAQIGGQDEEPDEDNPNASPGEFAGITPDALRQLLKDAGCGNTVSLGAVEGQRNASGYKLSTFEGVLKVAKAARDSH
ncbi:hypothetical protein AB0D10_41640 [Kitasatospora sp. NPDC048545]|uniref:hypothetical protein n=1 Tax=Kitasatospora sp. NPDC048545 TaxID=3157208 RepID=UPI0033F31D67